MCCIGDILYLGNVARCYLVFIWLNKIIMGLYSYHISSDRNYIYLQVLNIFIYFGNPHVVCQNPLNINCIQLWIVFRLENLTRT